MVEFPISQPGLASVAAPETQRGRVPELDGVRGIAIGLVVLWHYWVCILDATHHSPLARINGLLGVTWSGVDLFFILSGFLLGGILIDRRGSANLFTVFYSRRAARILPLYFVWILGFFLVRALLLGRPELGTPGGSCLFSNTLPLWSYLTFTQNFLMVHLVGFGANWLGMSWSLCVEEQFYLILPAMIRFIAPRRLPWVLAAIVITVPFLRMRLFSLGDYFPGYVLMPSRSDALMMGVLCAWAVRNKAIEAWLRTHRRTLYGALVVLLLGINGVLRLKKYEMNAVGYSWLALLYACFLLLVVTEKHGLAKTATGWRWLRWLGMRAYAIYMFHPAFLGLSHWLLRGHEPKISNVLDLGASLVALVATLTLAQLSWRFFEKPILSLGHRMTYGEVTVPSVDPSLHLSQPRRAENLGVAGREQPRAE